MITVSHVQLRTARTHLDLSQQAVADAVGTHKNVISRIESGQSNPQQQTREALISFYEDAGIEFIEHNGIRERAEVRAKIYRGRAGFIDFANDVYETIKKDGGGEVYVSNVDERLWDKWIGDYRDEYLAKMSALQNFKSKIIIRSDDDYIVAGYAEYRCVEPEDFGSMPFYVYGEKVAMILFREADCIVVVINNKEIAEAHRTDVFGRLWQSAHAADGSKN